MRNRGYRRWDGSSQWSPKSINGNVLWLRSDLGITLNPIAPQIPLAFEGCALANCTVPITNGADPFGGTQARKVLDNGVNGLHFAGQVATRSWNIGTNLTESVYAKAAELTWCWIGNTNHTAYINLSTGAVGTLVGGCTATTQSMGNGWWKITLSKTPTTVSDSALYLGLATGDGVSSYAGSSQGVFFYLADISAPQVSAWADQSGSGDANKNAVQATAANQPPYLASSSLVPGKPSIASTNLQSYLLATGAWGAALTPPFTICGVASATQDATNNYIWDSISTANQDALYAAVSGGGWTLYAGAAGPTDASGVDALQHAFIGYYSGGAGSQIFRDARTAKATAALGNNNLTGITLGNYAGGGNFAGGGELFEFAVYNKQLSAAEIANLLQYFGSRYNITIGA